MTVQELIERADAGDLPYGYCPIPCPNCGRVRLEHDDTGAIVCEKCRWDVRQGDYVDPPADPDADWFTG